MEMNRYWLTVRKCGEAMQRRHRGFVRRSKHVGGKVILISSHCLQQIAQVLLYFSVAVIPLPAKSQDLAKCDGVLVPSIESIKSDYKLLQAFAKVNAKALYNEIDKNKGSSAGGSGSYGAYGAAYNQSKNENDFSKNVEQILATEKFDLSEVDARSYYRKGVSDKQVEAWERCIVQVTQGGAVLLTGKDIDRSGFHLVVTWLPQRGIGSATLHIQVTNGAIDGKHDKQTILVGSGSEVFTVLKESPRAAVKVSASIARSIDTLMVAPPSPPPPHDAIACLSQDQVLRYTADDNHFKAPLNSSPCFVHTGFTGTKPDIDAWYRIKVPEPGSIKIVLTGTSQVFALQLRNSEGQVVKEPDPPRSAGGQIIETHLSPGEYVIRPQPITGPSQYHLNVSFSPDR